MKSSRILLLTAFLSVALAQSHRDPAAIKNPLAGRVAAVEAGRKGFRDGCAACHGANAEGGRGPNLAESENLRNMTDEQLFNTVRRGIPGTDMPGFHLPDSATWEIVTFVQSLSTPAFLTPITGNSDAGQALYFGKAGCANCHMIRGRGGFIGPDLTNIAATDTVTQLREGILRPNARVATGFLPVTAVLKNGSRIEGVAKNNSNYSIQILDAGGNLHLLDRSDLSEVTFQQKSLMPDNYAQSLTPEDLQNILAFLTKQVVRPDARPQKPR